MVQLEAPEVQMLQAGQEIQPDGGSSVRADVVVPANTVRAVHLLTSTAGMHGSRMRHGLWRGLVELPPCAAREWLQALAATRAPPRPAAGEASLALAPLHPAPPLQPRTPHGLERSTGRTRERERGREREKD